jgi:hypothetical protein
MQLKMVLVWVLLSVGQLAVVFPVVLAVVMGWTVPEVRTAPVAWLQLAGCFLPRQ